MLDADKDGEKSTDMWLDLSDEDSCNWMMFVRPAQNHLEQNLVAYQYGSEIYYTTIKNIQPKQELKVSPVDCSLCTFQIVFHVGFSGPVHLYWQSRRLEVSFFTRGSAAPVTELNCV